MANRLLGILGGSIRARRKVDNMAVIGIGMGEFSSASRLSSIHESLLSYFLITVSTLSSHLYSLCAHFSHINMVCPFPSIIHQARSLDDLVVEG